MPTSPLSLLLDWLARLPKRNKDYIVGLTAHQGRVLWPKFEIRSNPDDFLVHMQALVEGETEDSIAAVTITLRGQVGFLLLDLTSESTRKRQQQMRDANLPSDLDQRGQEEFAESWDRVQASWRELSESISDRAIDQWMKREFLARKHR